MNPVWLKPRQKILILATQNCKYVSNCIEKTGTEMLGFDKTTLPHSVSAVELLVSIPDLYLGLGKGQQMNHVKSKIIQSPIKG